MSSPYKRYSREFKLEVVRRVQVTGQRQIDVAKELVAMRTYEVAQVVQPIGSVPSLSSPR